jgi:hypothetical protein
VATNVLYAYFISKHSNKICIQHASSHHLVVA